MSRPSDEVRRKQLLAAFQMPSFQTIMSRKSSITNAFVCSVIPIVQPNLDEIEQALKLLGMEATDVRCAYCGDKSSEWDHLRPLVLHHRPTGFISEIANLVPACGKCNQSKGNSGWREWMLSNAKHSPTGRALARVAERLACLDAYERWRPPTKIDFELILGSADWQKYWSLWEKMIAEMRQCQDVAELLRRRITEHLVAR